MLIYNSKLSNLISSRQFRFTIGIIAALIVFFVKRQPGNSLVPLISSWTAFTVVYIALSWFVIAIYHPKDVMKKAKTEDTTGGLIFLLVLTAAICSLAGIFLLLKTLPVEHSKTFIALPFASVFFSWILVHTIFVFRYAHLYYSAPNVLNDAKNNMPGLEFPGESFPDYLDFAYFSFILGMTFQVSDVQITSRKIRRLALLHGCISFIYNTLILALSINIVSGIVSKK